MEEACKEGNIFVTTTGCTDIVQGRYCPSPGCMQTGQCSDIDMTAQRHGELMHWPFSSAGLGFANRQLGFWSSVHIFIHTHHFFGAARHKERGGAVVQGKGRWQSHRPDWDGIAGPAVCWG